MHVVGGNNMIARRARGSDESLSESVDLAEAHRASAAGAVDGFALPDAMDAIYDLPFGQVPGNVLIGMRTTDVLTHAWDLAAATGQSTDLDPGVQVSGLASGRREVPGVGQHVGGAHADQHVSGNLT